MFLSLFLQNVDLLLNVQDFFLPPVVGLDKLAEFHCVALALDVESEWMEVKNVHFLGLEVPLQIVEKRLFVA